MKSIVLVFAILAIAVLFLGCKRGSSDISPQKSGVVTFSDAGVSIEVGTGWARVDKKDPGLPICPPVLLGAAGTVNAMLFDPKILDMQAAANVMRLRFDHDGDAIRDSYQQEAFTADGGLCGRHISYSETMEKDGRIEEMRCHIFIVQRQDRRCVIINYITTPSTDSDTVRQTIQKSLKLL